MGLSQKNWDTPNTSWTLDANKKRIAAPCTSQFAINVAYGLERKFRYAAFPAGTCFGKSTIWLLVRLEDGLVLRYNSKKVTERKKYGSDIVSLNVPVLILSKLRGPTLQESSDSAVTEAIDKVKENHKHVVPS